MALPRLSFPRGGSTTTGVPLALYGAFTAVMFVVFLVVTFPYDTLVQRGLAGLQGAPVRVVFDGAHFAWHRGIALTGVELYSTDATIRSPVFEAETVWVRPALGQLVRGNLYAFEAQAELYGGFASATADLADGRASGTIDLQALSLGRYRPVATMLEEGRLGGRIDARVAFEAPLAMPETGQASGEIRLTRAALQEAKISGFGVPDIHLDEAKLDFGLQNGRVDVKDFDAKGKEIILAADGQIALRDPVQDSVLNMRATIMPGPEAPDSIRGLLQLIPRPAGAKPDAPVRVTGTIARPRVR